MRMNDSEIYQLLNLAEDYVLDGFRHEHPPLALGAGAEPAPGPSRQQIMEDIARQVADCTRCALHRERRQTVSGEGVIDPLVMVIGEGPGGEEDRIGRPFVGRAGQYLDRWLAAIGLDRKTNCFIGNIVKCRPPGNRDPLPEEAAACLPYLKQQIGILKPRAILTLGRIATQILCGRSEGIGRLRGKDLDYQGIPVVATYHPSAVLRNTDLRSPVWDDLRRLRALPIVADRLEGSPADNTADNTADSPGARPERSPE
jgi:uracil-DNA glycosylase family 4